MDYSGTALALLCVLMMLIIGTFKWSYISSGNSRCYLHNSNSCNDLFLVWISPFDHCKITLQHSSVAHRSLFETYLHQVPNSTKNTVLVLFLNVVLSSNEFKPSNHVFYLEFTLEIIWGNKSISTTFISISAIYNLRLYGLEEETPCLHDELQLAIHPTSHRPFISHTLCFLHVLFPQKRKEEEENHVLNYHPQFSS